MSKIGKILEKVFIISSFMILIVVVIFAVDAMKHKKELYIFGYKPYIITTGSMEPDLKVNSVVIIKKGNYDDVKVNDIISFKVSEFSNNACHQVIEITDKGFVTKGTNNSNPDFEMVTKKTYVGKMVWKTNATANYINLVKKNGILLTIVLPILGIAILVVGIKLLPRGKNEKEEK